jgi:L-lactate dehydrogenase complex protein LldG
MAATDADAFEAALDDLGCGLTRTTAGEATEAVARLVDPPAVGTELPFEGVSLPETVESSPTPTDCEAATTGVTAARLGVAAYGSVVLEQAGASEVASLLPERHVAVLAASDLVADLAGAFEELGALAREGADLVLATGPSATADMGELVVGAHGPEAVAVVLLEDR